MYVCQGFHNEKLYSDSLLASSLSFTTKNPQPNKFTCTAKFRYRQPDTEVEVEVLEDNKVKSCFIKSQCVLLLQDKRLFSMMVMYVLGGAIIWWKYIKTEKKTSTFNN